MARTFAIAGHVVEVPPLDPGLYLVATPIGNLRDITIRALETLAACDLLACEDTRITRRLLDRYAIAQKPVAYHEHNAARAGPRLLAADERSGEKELCGVRRSDELGEHIADAESRMDPQPREIRAVFGITVRHPDVGQQGQTKPSAHGVAVERGNDRHLHVEDAQERLVHRVGGLRRGLSEIVSLKRGAEIGSGAETTASAGDHQAPNLGIIPGDFDPFRKGIEELRAHRIALLGAVEGQHSDPSSRFVLDRSLTHPADSSGRLDSGNLGG